MLETREVYKHRITHVKIPIQQRKTLFPVYKMHGMKNVKRRTVDQIGITQLVRNLKDSADYTRWNENIRYENPTL